MIKLSRHCQESPSWPLDVAFTIMMSHRLEKLIGMATKWRYGCHRKWFVFASSNDLVSNRSTTMSFEGSRTRFQKTGKSNLTIYEISILSYTSRQIHGCYSAESWLIARRSGVNILLQLHIWTTLKYSCTCHRRYKLTGVLSMQNTCLRSHLAY